MNNKYHIAFKLCKIIDDTMITEFNHMQCDLFGKQ